MRVAAVVVIATSVKGPLDVFQAVDKVCIQNDFPKRSIESFNLVVLIWLCGLDVIGGDLELLSPIFERVGNELRSIVAEDATGFASVPKGRLQHY